MAQKPTSKFNVALSPSMNSFAAFKIHYCSIQVRFVGNAAVHIQDEGIIF